jgi:hypothetical protein
MGLYWWIVGAGDVDNECGKTVGLDGLLELCVFYLERGS